jgi:hypothetical protein
MRILLVGRIARRDLPRTAVDADLDACDRRAQAIPTILQRPFSRTTLAGADLICARPIEVSTHSVLPSCFSSRIVT